MRLLEDGQVQVGVGQLFDGQGVGRGLRSAQRLVVRRAELDRLGSHVETGRRQEDGLAALGGDAKPGSLFNTHPRLIGLIGLALTFGMFAVALRFDTADRMRVTRRSDVAFWLHLTTAPLLLYSAFAVLFGSDGFWWSDKPSAAEAMAAIGIVTLMVLIGIIIDRRAFVTSGLISLGAALAIITREIGVDISSITAFAFLAVGVIVLLLGSGWQQLRAMFVEAMPEAIRSRVPPVQR